MIELVKTELEKYPQVKNVAIFAAFVIAAFIGLKVLHFAFSLVVPAILIGAGYVAYKVLFSKEEDANV